MFQDEEFCEAMLDMGKFQGREAVKNKDYRGAMHIYTKVHYYSFILRCIYFRYNFSFDIWNITHYFISLN